MGDRYVDVEGGRVPPHQILRDAFHAEKQDVKDKVKVGFFSFFVLVRFLRFPVRSGLADCGLIFFHLVSGNFSWCYLCLHLSNGFRLFLNVRSHGGEAL